MRLATAISTSTSTPPSDEQEAIGARGFPWFHDHHAWLIGKGVELAAIFLGDLHGGLVKCEKPYGGSPLPSVALHGSSQWKRAGGA